MALEPEALCWWQHGVIYQVYLRSFQDSNGDGIGDLAGVIRQLDYLAGLGVDAIWLNPFYPSPINDFGYDVADYCGVDPQYGTLADFDHLLGEAHTRGIKLILDLVVNHTSDQHPWFIEARRSQRSPKRDWYVWRDPDPDGGPPNNWRSFFSGRAWTYDEATGQYYLHHFLPGQPDLNYRNPQVLEVMLEVMRFWLERGVDGFRLDALGMLIEDAQFREEPINPLWKPGTFQRGRLIHLYTDDQPETHAIVQAMRRVADAYPGRVLIAETYLPYDRLMAYYGTREAPECHLPFNFHLITDAMDRWDADVVRRVVEEYEAAQPSWAWPSWVLGNHDQPRLTSRLGEAQARVAAMLLFTLRGTPTWYYGDEIGMLNGDIPPERVKDPAGMRQPGVPNAGRDPERTPM
ncbi:MAG: alpha-amylase, partial [Chloroflexi bacterium]|nr:alpha-amylase [Chloroflexota bacterium]